MIKIEMDSRDIEFTITKFSDGTRRILFKEDISNYVSTKVIILWKYQLEEELIDLIYLTRHIQEKVINHGPIILRLPYVPNARMDRVEDNKDVFTLKYFTEVINSLGFSKIQVLDPHSRVTEALINNVSTFPLDYIIKRVLQTVQHQPSSDLFLFPDKGACDRYLKKLKEITESNVLVGYGEKQRDWVTSNIVSLKLNIPQNTTKFTNIIIMDDIISSGSTIINCLAEIIKLLKCNIKKVNVFIYGSHIEYPALERLSSTIDNMYPDLNWSILSLKQGLLPENLNNKHLLYI